MAKKKTIKKVFMSGIKAQVKKHPELKPAGKKLKKQVKKADKRVHFLLIPVLYYLYRYGFEESLGTFVKNQIENLKKRKQKAAGQKEENIEQTA